METYIYTQQHMLTVKSKYDNTNFQKILRKSYDKLKNNLRQTNNHIKVVLTLQTTVIAHINVNIKRVLFTQLIYNTSRINGKYVTFSVYCS